MDTMDDDDGSVAPTEEGVSYYDPEARYTISYDSEVDAFEIADASVAGTFDSGRSGPGTAHTSVNEAIANSSASYLESVAGTFDSVRSGSVTACTSANEASSNGKGSVSGRPEIYDKAVRKPGRGGKSKKTVLSRLRHGTKKDSVRSSSS